MNEDLDFVGLAQRAAVSHLRPHRTGLRPADLARARHPWLGLRVANALGAFLPTDVQANLGSPDFGSFYNSEYRQFRIHVRFER